MNKFVEGYKVGYAQLYGGTVTATVTKVTDTHVTLTESWTAEDTGETVYEDTTYEKHTDNKGEYVTVWEYHGEECNIYGKEDTKMRIEYMSKDVGRGYRVSIIDGDDTVSTRRRDVELMKGDTTVAIFNSGCIGIMSAEYWLGNAYDRMNRIIFIMDSIDMARHNRLCYSQNWLMSAPKPEYADKWHAELNREKMLLMWLDELMQYSGKESKLYGALVAEFDQYSIAQEV